MGGAGQPHRQTGDGVSLAPSEDLSADMGSLQHGGPPRQEAVPPLASSTLYQMCPPPAASVYP